MKFSSQNGGHKSCAVLMFQMIMWWKARQGEFLHKLFLPCFIQTLLLHQQQRGKSGTSCWVYLTLHVQTEQASNTSSWGIIHSQNLWYFCSWSDHLRPSSSLIKIPWKYEFDWIRGMWGLMNFSRSVFQKGQVHGLWQEFKSDTVFSKSCLHM